MTSWRILQTSSIGFPPGGTSNAKSQNELKGANLGVSFRKETLGDKDAIGGVWVEGRVLEGVGEALVDR